MNTKYKKIIFLIISFLFLIFSKFQMEKKYKKNKKFLMFDFIMENIKENQILYIKMLHIF